jgi:hypothetical protein
VTVAAGLGASPAAGSESASKRRARWPAAVSSAGGALALAAVAAPLAIAAATIAIQRPDALPDGDQAADELALIRSTRLAQLVGNYSRYRWNHPGPAWFYALDPFYAPLGAHSWSAYVAVLCLHAVIAGLVVAVVWRRAGALTALVTAGLLLLYVRTLGEPAFRLVWPPYALMLPMILLFVLAAAGAAGSTPAMAAALVAGSFAVQTHVGTVPVVLAVLGSMVVVRLAPRFTPWRADSAPPARSSRLPGAALTVGGCVLAAAMWVPVAVDQLTGSPGNLTKLYDFFSTHHDTHAYGAALSALGKLLEVYPLGQVPATFGPESAGVPAPRLLAVALFAAAAGGLAVLGARLRDRFALALALLLLAALPVVTISITRVVGPVYPYLLVWVTTFPLLLAVGWTALVARARPWTRWGSPMARAATPALAAALCILVVALASGRAAAFERLPAAMGDQADPDTRTAWAITELALAGEPRRSVRVVVADNDRWVMAAGLVLQLEKHGWTVTVNRDYVFIFGDATRPSGTEAVELVVVSAGNLQSVERQVPDARPIGRTPDAYLLVGHAPGPA